MVPVVHAGGRRRRSATLRTALTGGLALAAAVAVAGPAAAGPAVTGPAAAVPAALLPAAPLPVLPVTVEQAEAQLDAAYRHAEVAAERYNAAAAAAAAAATDIAAAQAAAARQEQAAARLRAAVGSQAAASYRSGGLGLTTRFLLADDADEFLQTVTTTQTVRDHQARRLAGLERQVVLVRGEQSRVVAVGRLAEQVTGTRATEKASLDRQVAAAQAVLARLSVRQRAELAARAASASAADRAQARVLLAHAQAELARPVAGGGPTGPVAGYDRSGTGGNPDAGGSNSRVPDGGADSGVPDIGSAPGTVPPAAANDRVSRVLAYAAAQLGDRYVWGATGPDAFDCSGLVLRAWQQAGVTLPRTSAVQSATGRPVARADLRPGDLVFFYAPVSHVGLYIGGGKMINAANPRTGVRVASVDTPAYAGAVRPG